MAATARGRSLPVPNSAAAALRPRPPPPPLPNVAFGKARNLIQLTQPDIYLVVHRHFVSLLRMVYYGSRELRLSESARQPIPSALTKEETSALGNIGLIGLVKVLSFMARGSKITIKGKDRDEVSTTCHALQKLTNSQQHPTGHEVPFMDPKNGGAVYYERTLPAVIPSKENHTIELTTRRCGDSAREVAHRAAPAVVALAEALVTSAEGEVSDGLAVRLVQSRRHEYLTVATIVQGHLSAQNRTGQPQFFASADIQRLCSPSQFL